MNTSSKKQVIDLKLALDQQQSGVTMTPHSGFSDAVNKRLLTAEATARANTALAPAETTQNVLRLLDVAVRAPTRKKAVMWLHRASDVAHSAYGPHSACHSGCSHCCHIPVTVSATEAAFIGRAIGRTPLPLSEHVPVEIDGYQSPCPLLVENKCTAYQWRPSVCRTHMNMDRDELLCRLVDGQAIPVPYFDA